MNASHSPGPFTVEKIGLGWGLHRHLSAEEKRRFRLDEDEPRPMSLLMVDRDGYALVSEEGDARLFAGAPELLAAMKASLALADKVNPSGVGRSKECAEAYARCVAAVAAATLNAEGVA